MYDLLEIGSFWIDYITSVSMQVFKINIKILRIYAPTTFYKHHCIITLGLGCRWDMVKS